MFTRTDGQGSRLFDLEEPWREGSPRQEHDRWSCRGVLIALGLAATLALIYALVLTLYAEASGELYATVASAAVEGLLTS